MKKKLGLIFFILLFSAVTFIGCGGDAGGENPAIHTHSLGEWVEKIDATCEENGTLGHYTCSECNKNFDKGLKELQSLVIEANGHALSDWGNSTATCDEVGTEARTCENCDYKETREVPPLGHKLWVWNSKIPATCEEDGIVGHYLCSVCQKGFDAEKRELESLVIEAKGHTFGKWQGTASCTEAGEEFRECSSCDYVEVRDFVATGHDFSDFIPFHRATCTENGTLGHYHCQRCEKNFDEDFCELDSVLIEAEGHSLSEWGNSSATCLDGGTETRACENCSYSETRSVMPYGHDFGEWEAVREASCTEDVDEVRKCERCDYSETRVREASGHEMGAWVFIGTVSCTELANEKRACLNCDFYETRKSSSYGHSYGKWIGNSNTGYYLCSMCGKKFDAEKHENTYEISSITVNNNPLEEYLIAYDASDEAKAIAASLQKTICEKAGIFIEAVEIQYAPAKAIRIQLSETAVENGFRVSLSGDTLKIECSFKYKFIDAYEIYSNSVFEGKTGAIALKSYDFPTNLGVVKYSDFGAVGDGKTDDTEAIRAAHNYANRTGGMVVGDKNATYYIAKVSSPIIIKTNTDWCGAKFIFDASKFQSSDSGNVFKIDNDEAPINFSAKDSQITKINAEKSDGLVIKGINHGDGQTTKLDVGIREPLMLKVSNSDAKTYIRWGYVDTKGAAQCEVIIVDKYGNIDPSTPFLLDYEKITSITAYKIDVEPITVGNAHIESRNSLVNLLGAYKSIAHGILISRPNVTLTNVIHTVTQEYTNTTPTRQNPETGLWEDVSSEGFTISGGIVYLNGKQYKGDDVKPFTGYSYSGIVNISNTHNTLIKGCGFQARYHYVEGTYDISCSYANRIEFRNCTQNNFFEKDKDGNDTQVANLGIYWGIAGTNYCKNMYYVDSVLTRYDAHAGVFNGGVKGGKLAVLRLIGGGTFTIEGVDFHARGVPVQLREDYGATFNGTVIIKDTYFNYIWGTNTNYNLVLVDAPTAHIYNGYRTYFPNLIIDNIGVETTNDVITLVNVTNQTYKQTGDHYPSRCPIRDDVSNPDALFTYYYETKNPNIVEQEPEKFYFLKGFKKVNKAVTKLVDGEYTVVDNGNGTYTVVAEGVKNLQPYVPPSFIEIRNMKNAKNVNGKKLTIQLYNSDFFANTEIIDADGVLKRVDAPK